MRRRNFIKGIVGSAVAWPLASRAQQPAKLPTIGYLGATTPSVESQRIAANVKCIRPPFEGLESGGDLLRALDFEDGDLVAEPARRRLYLAHLT